MRSRPDVPIRWLLLAVFASLAAGCARPTMTGDLPTGRTEGYFPAGQWRTSPPEAQGLDSEALSELMIAVDAQHVPIHSLQILRHGHLLLDAYFYPFQRDERHDVASVTKSVTTTLVGLALERGALTGLDAQVYPLLDQTSPTDERKSRIRLRHLLTTSSGLDCGPEPYEREMLAMAASDNWVRFALDLPMRETPGTRFVYCSPGFHLLSALVTRGTGLAAEDFAREALFAPIGITDWRWPRDPQGINQGAGDLQLRPTDLLRLGYLFLHRGEWSGRQVVPQSWIAQATRAQVDTPSSERYGFGWWISTDIRGMYQGVGRGGQRLIVWPAEDVVVVMTGGGFDPDLIAPFLLRSMKSNGPIAANPTGHERLLARVQEAARPTSAAASAPALPARAVLVSGVDFALEPNPLDVRDIQVQFIDRSLAQVRFGLRETTLVVPVGLDGAYRVGIDPASGSRVAGRGRWTGPDQFVLEIDTIARISHFTLAIDFEDGGLTGQVSERAGLIRGLALRGRAQR
jgi:CubicO group peptidase (beta-lactamase class C family)